MKVNQDDSILFLDTSSPSACVGVWSQRRVCSEVHLSETRRHAELLHSAIEEALALAACDFDALTAIVVGQGPGSFVGLRVAIATAKGIALARGIPLFGVGTLVSLAGVDSVPSGAGIALIDARRGEVYAQLVAREGESVQATGEAIAVVPATVRDRFTEASFWVGNGVALLPPSTNTNVIEIDVAGPTVGGMARAFWTRVAAGHVVADERDMLLPAYCRAPDAKLPAHTQAHGE